MRQKLSTNAATDSFHQEKKRKKKYCDWNVHIHNQYIHLHMCGGMGNSSVCRHLLWKCSMYGFFWWYYSTFQVLLKKSSGSSMVSWCYWVYWTPTPPPSGSTPWESIDLGGGGSEVLGLLGWGGGGWEEVEDDLMLAPHPPGWSSGVPVEGNWTSFSSPHSTWGRRRGSGQPSVMGVGGWPGGLVAGSRSPEVEPPASEAGPANDKKLSERAGWGDQWDVCRWPAPDETGRISSEKYKWEKVKEERAGGRCINDVQLKTDVSFLNHQLQFLQKTVY